MTDRYSLVAPHAKGKRTVDVIFEAGRRATEAVARVGKAAVVNATMGTIQNDQEQLAFMPTVAHILKEMAPADFAAYSPFQGTPEFRKAIEEWTLGDFRPEMYTATFATPGSTGALRNAIWNWLAEGQAALVSDWHWSPYSTILGEHHRRAEFYSLFDNNRQFQLTDLEQNIRRHLKEQGRALVILNDPCQNPTGYDLSMDEWRGLRDLLFDLARNTEAPVILVVDVPYIDYGSRGRDNRAFFSLFSGAPQNLLLLLAASISKSLGMYGMRTGALIGLSTDKGIMEEFVEVNEVSARGVWTNVPRAGMLLVSRIYQDLTFRSQVEQERESLRQLLVDRSTLLLAEATAAGLPLMPYRSGFFVTLPTSRSQEVVSILDTHHIFAVPMKMGVRFAVSSVPAAKLPGVAARIKAAFDQVDA